MRALLIENDVPLARALKQGLESEGYTVDLADTARIADRQACSSRYDLVLVDMAIPKIDKLKILQRWRTEGTGPRVLFLNGPNPAPARPVEKQTPPAMLRIDDMEIDTWARTVTRAGQRIRLTPREYALLHLLASHQGKIVTRAMILEHMYDQVATSASNVIDVYIRYLRNKIDRGFGKPLIQTLWGQGYRLKVCD